MAAFSLTDSDAVRQGQAIVDDIVFGIGSSQDKIVICRDRSAFGIDCIDCMSIVSLSFSYRGNVRTAFDFCRGFGYIRRAGDTVKGDALRRIRSIHRILQVQGQAMVCCIIAAILRDLIIRQSGNGDRRRHIGHGQLHRTIGLINRTTGHIFISCRQPALHSAQLFFRCGSADFCKISCIESRIGQAFNFAFIAINHDRVAAFSLTDSDAVRQGQAIVDDIVFGIGSSQDKIVICRDRSAFGIDCIDCMSIVSLSFSYRGNVRTAFDFCRGFGYIRRAGDTVKGDALRRIRSIHRILQVQGQAMVCCIIAAILRDLIIRQSGNGDRRRHIGHGQLHRTISLINRTAGHIFISCRQPALHGTQLFFRCRPALGSKSFNVERLIGQACDFAFIAINSNLTTYMENRSKINISCIIYKQVIRKFCRNLVCLNTVYIFTRNINTIITSDICCLLNGFIADVYTVNDVSIGLVIRRLNSSIGSICQFNASPLELCDIDSIRIYSTGCQIGNLTGMRTATIRITA